VRACVRACVHVCVDVRDIIQLVHWLVPSLKIFVVKTCSCVSYIGGEEATLYFLILLDVIGLLTC
jgi:hypothetical protein